MLDRSGKVGGKDMVRCPKCGHEFTLELNCLRCNHTWAPRKPNNIPKVCPKCKSPYWNKPRQKNNRGGM